MTRITVADLIGEELDIAVALADGHRVRRSTIADAPGIHELRPGGAWEWIRRPSTAWEHGGPIIDREGIDLIGCTAYVGLEQVSGGPIGTYSARGYGPTRLIAAMRAYVASKFGETLDLDEALSRSADARQ